MGTQIGTNACLDCGYLDIPESPCPCKASGQPVQYDMSPGQALAESVWPKLEALTAEERVLFFGELLGNWCEHCGRVHPGYPCQCENDD